MGFDSNELGAVLGHLANQLDDPEADGALRVRMVGISWRDFIPACGGLTQVLGKALEGTTYADRPTPYQEFLPSSKRVLNPLALPMRPALRTTTYRTCLLSDHESCLGRACSKEASVFPVSNVPAANLRWFCWP